MSVWLDLVKVDPAPPAVLQEGSESIGDLVPLFAEAVERGRTVIGGVR
ncbi:hypothetical protein [Streptomyces sp. bgisy126]